MERWVPKNASTHRFEKIEAKHAKKDTKNAMNLINSSQNELLQQILTPQNMPLKDGSEA
jgi:hypothetical protein